MTFAEPGVTTPYSSVTPLIQDEPLWAPPLDRERIAAYAKYEEIYWQSPEAFKLAERGDDRNPIYIPNPRVIVDNTAHFWMKGLEIKAKTEGELKIALDKFLAREVFVPKFHTGKHSGVARGDFILHLTADPTKPEGTRISVNTVDPAAYFPEFDDDDLDRVKAVSLVEQIIDPDNPNKVVVKRLVYSYRVIDGKRRVQREEATYKPEDWWNPTKREKLDQILEPALLPEAITTIPVYLFKNKDWQGDPFGSSELRGYERVQQAINQGTLDEEMALALDGMGVWATDAGRPVDDNGKETDWEVWPGKVVEVPTGSFFRRVEGLKSVTPMQDHLKFLIDSIYEGTATFRPGQIDAQVAQSGIALAIKFLPTLAKIEQRDDQATAQLKQFFFDWRQWHFAYENKLLPDDEDAILITLGDKLPKNKTDILNALNNMRDRSVVTKKWYREEVATLYGFVIPDDMDTLLAEEATKELEAKLKATTAEFALQNSNPANLPNNGNRSNNKNAPNESKGTEAQPTQQQGK